MKLQTVTELLINSGNPTSTMPTLKCITEVNKAKDKCLALLNRLEEFPTTEAKVAVFLKPLNKLYDLTVNHIISQGNMDQSCIDTFHRLAVGGIQSWVTYAPMLELDGEALLAAVKKNDFLEEILIEIEATNNRNLRHLIRKAFRQAWEGAVFGITSEWQRCAF